MRGCEKHSQSWRAHLRLPLRLNQVVNSLKLLPTLPIWPTWPSLPTWPTWPTWPTLPTDHPFCHESQTADLHQCMAHLAPGGSGEERLIPRRRWNPGNWPRLRCQGWSPRFDQPCHQKGNQVKATDILIKEKIAIWWYWSWAGIRDVCEQITAS